MDSEIAAALDRIEQRQTAYEVVAHRILGILEVQGEKLTAILKAATLEPGPSPVAEALKQILKTMQSTEALLTALPGALAHVIREELQPDENVEWEPAEGAFETPEEDRR